VPPPDPQRHRPARSSVRNDCSCELPWLVGVSALTRATWFPAYWRWTGSRYVWVDGGWLAARPGFRFVGAHWSRLAGGWVFVAGGWEPI